MDFFVYWSNKTNNYDQPTPKFDFRKNTSTYLFKYFKL